MRAELRSGSGGELSANSAFITRTNSARLNFIAPMSLAAGDHLGPYEIVSLLGKGGMGEVWRARDPRLGREVAIKVSAQQFTDRFEREARAIAPLNHPNICTLYDVGPHYLVMELVEGPTLAERIAQGKLPLEEALGIARQMAAALEEAHEKGVVHRDLKPANVKIKPGGAVKVLDFGLAKMAAEEIPLTPDSPTMMSMPGMILGTAGYMAPEQARGKPVDKRADIWAFGVVLHEMLTAKRLFQGEDVSHTLAAVIMKEPDLSEVPAQVVPLLKRCLEKDPKNRLRDIGDAMGLVEAASEGTAPSRSRLGTDGGVETAERRRSLVWMAAAGVFAIVAGLLGFVHFREKAPEAPVVTAFIPPPDKTTFNIRGGLGQVSFPALSPDGRRLVFGAGSAEGKSQLWVRSLGALTAQPLAGTDNATHPFWSPDSKLVGFFAGGKLKKIDADGGTAITLCDAADGRGGTWSQSGTIVFSSDRLYAVSAAGGKPSAMTAAIPGVDFAASAVNLFTPRWPSFLPDGRHYLYLTGSTDGQKGAVIRVGAIDSIAEGKTVADARSNAVYVQGYLLYLREDSLVAQPFDLKSLATIGEATSVVENVQSTGAGRRGVFSVSENGLLIYAQGSAGVNNGVQWIWFDRFGKRSGILSDSTGFLDPEFSPDGKSLATVVTDYTTPNADIWLYDVARGLRTRFTFDPAAEDNPVWSPDGRSIFFRSTRKGAGDLYRKLADGSGGEELVYADPLNKDPSSVSPDGKVLLYSANRAQKSTVQDLWVLPLEGERKPFPFLQTAFSERKARFSPDGHWIAYESNESGRNEIYVAPFNGSVGTPGGTPGNTPGGKRQISSAGGTWPRWRRDGKELFYMEAGGRLMAAQVSVKGAAMEVGAVMPLFNVPVRASLAYDVAADGQRFLVVVPPEQNAAEPLTLVQNWMGLLKK